MLQALRERLLACRGLPVLCLEVFLHLCADMSSLTIKIMVIVITIVITIMKIIVITIVVIL
jgi:hypothetical protein